MPRVRLDSEVGRAASRHDEHANCGQDSGLGGDHRPREAEDQAQKRRGADCREGYDFRLLRDRPLTSPVQDDGTPPGMSQQLGFDLGRAARERVGCQDEKWRRGQKREDRSGQAGRQR